AGRKMAARYKAKIESPHGRRTCLQVTVERGDGRKPLVARFGGIPLKRQQKAVLLDRIPERVTYPRKELPLRLLKGECEICERTGSVSVHQVLHQPRRAGPGPARGDRGQPRLGGRGHHRPAPAGRVPVSTSQRPSPPRGRRPLLWPVT